MNILYFTTCTHLIRELFIIFLVDNLPILNIIMSSTVIKSISSLFSIGRGAMFERLGITVLMAALALICQTFPVVNADIDLNTKTGSKICVGKICVFENERALLALIYKFLFQAMIALVGEMIHFMAFLFHTLPLSAFHYYECCGQLFNGLTNDRKLYLTAEFVIQIAACDFKRG